jgi:Transposase IS4
MLRMKLVTTVEDESAHAQAASSGLFHSTNVWKELVMPWASTGRIVAAESYFASVGSAGELYNAGIRFFGVAKTATRRCPMSELLRINLSSRGDRIGLLSLNKSKEPWIMAFTWVDCERRYFLSTCSSLAPGTPYTRKGLRQVSMEPKPPPEVV